MTSVRLDYRFFLYVFICFSVSSFLVTGILVYYLSQIADAHSRNAWTLLRDEPDQVAQFWSRDPMVMQGIRARGVHHGTVKAATLTQVNFNDTCVGFVWSGFRVKAVHQYKVVISNMKVPSMAPIQADLGKLELEFVQCHLNLSTPYLVNLTLVGEDAAGTAETATGVMWTSHQLPPPPDLA
ncbi:unnamed protein product, partial [Candidula unifasciata]